MPGRIFWWTCHHPGCLDRMQPSESREQIEHDQAAHLADKHPGATLTNLEMRIQAWPETDHTR